MWEQRRICILMVSVMRGSTVGAKMNSSAEYCKSDMITVHCGVIVVG